MSGSLQVFVVSVQVIAGHPVVALRQPLVEEVEPSAAAVSLVPATKHMPPTASIRHPHTLRIIFISLLNTLCSGTEYPAASPLPSETTSRDHIHADRHPEFAGGTVEVEFGRHLEGLAR